MLQTLKGKTISLRSARLGKAIAVAMLCAVAACGDGSDGTAASGTRISAASAAVPNANANAKAFAGPDLPPQASIVARSKFDIIVNSTNPAMLKLARMQCIKRARISPGVDMVAYPALTRAALRQDNCAVIMDVEPD